MNNFDLRTPTRILSGKDAITGLRAHIPSGANVLLTYGSGSIKKPAFWIGCFPNWQSVTFNVRRHEPNPVYETLIQAAEIIRKENVTFLLDVGGGSVPNGTKFIAAAVHYPENNDHWHLLETGGADIKSAIPMGSVLTLPATGSESNNGAIISRRPTGDKQVFRSPFVQPVFAILNPVYTYTLPPCQVANGIIDAVVHTIEQF